MQRGFFMGAPGSASLAMTGLGVANLGERDKDENEK